MPVVPLQCPLCTGVLQIDSAWGGQQVACPLCHGTIAVPPQHALLVMLTAPSADVATTLHCPTCAGPVQVAAHQQGQQVGCPHCGSVTMVPALTSSPPPDAFAAPQQLPPREQPATIDELLPPGAAAGAVPASSQPSIAAKAEDRYPPGYQPHRPAPYKEKPTDDRYPPTAPRPSAIKPPREQPVDERLPPPRPSFQPALPEKRQPPPKVDVTDLLPPGATESAPPAAAAPSAVGAPASLLEPLLPPGAADMEPASVPQEQVPIPVAPKRPASKAANLPPGAIALPTADGEMVVVTQSPKTVGSGDDAVEVRRLAPEEKARRRLRRNALLWTICILVLLVVFYFLTR
jgi:hypothetical protein